MGEPHPWQMSNQMNWRKQEPTDVHISFWSHLAEIIWKKKSCGSVIHQPEKNCWGPTENQTVEQCALQIKHTNRVVKVFQTDLRSLNSKSYKTSWWRWRWRHRHVTVSHSQPNDRACLWEVRLDAAIKREGRLKRVVFSQQLMVIIHVDIDTNVPNYPTVEKSQIRPKRY